MARWMILAAAACLLGGLAGCDDLPDDDPGALAKVTAVAIFEPGDTGEQTVLLSHPVPLNQTVGDSASHVAEGELRLSRPGGDFVELLEHADRGVYAFDRADFPLAPGDSVLLEIAGDWNGRPYDGAAWTRIVSPEGLAWTEKPSDRSHGLDADTLMVHDESDEENFANPTAFHVNATTDANDGRDYGYQIEFLSVVLDSASGEWVRTPRERLKWLRDDEERAWQVGPYPDLRLPPGDQVLRQAVSWGFFVFVDGADSWIDGENRERDLGYYRVTLRRCTPELTRFYFTSHWWIQEEEYDPIDFNLQGTNLQGVVGSCARIDFRVAIAGDL